MSEPKFLDVAEVDLPFDTEDERCPTPVAEKRPRTRSQKVPTGQTMPSLDLNILLKFIKTYDGNRDTLNSFIINCDNAYNLADNTQKHILFKYILCQLQGKAELACSIKEFNSWDQLKDFLKTQFSERKHYSHLLTDLQESKQANNENASQYALRVETYLSQLLTEITLTNTKAKELPGRTAAMEELALHHFLMGLHPRISNIVRCKSPRTLNEAINFAISEERIQQTLYRRNSNAENKIPNRNPRPLIFNNPNSQHRPQTSNSAPFRRAPNQVPNISCGYCKFPGHSIEQCRKREYNNRVRAQFAPRPSTSNFNPQQFRRVNFMHDQTDETTPTFNNDEYDHPEPENLN